MFSGFSATLIMMTTLASAPQNMVLEFSTTGCVPCQSMAPIVQNLQQEGYAIQQVNAQQQPELAQRFRVRMYPTFIVIKNGQEVERVEGMMSESRLRELTPKLEAVENAATTAQPPPTKSILTQGLAGMTIAQGATGYERAVLGQPAIPSELNPQPQNKITKLNGYQNNPPQQNSSTSIKDNLTLLDKYLPDIKLSDNTPVIRGQSESPSNSTTAIPVSNDSLLSATVRIRIREKNGVNFGTGTIIESKVGQAVILTCAHILRDLSADGKIEVEFFTAKGPIMMIGKRLADNIDADVGMITVPSDMIFPVARVAKLENSSRLNDPVISYGCSSGQDPSREELTVSACNKYVGPENIECTGVPTRGRSGGGLFNLKGEIVGICSAADPQANRGLYCGLLPIHDMLKTQKFEQLIPGTNSNLRVAETSYEKQVPAEIDALNAKLMAKLDASKDSPLAKTIDQLISPTTVENVAAIDKSNATELQQAQGAKLTIIIEVPGSPEKTRTVIIPSATEKIIHEITREKQLKSNHQGLLDIGMRRKLEPTDLSIKFDTIPVNRRQINPNWMSHHTSFKLISTQEQLPYETNLEDFNSKPSLQKFVRNTSTVVRKQNVVNNSSRMMKLDAGQFYFSEIALCGSYGLNQNRQAVTSAFLPVPSR